MSNKYRIKKIEIRNLVWFEVQKKIRFIPVWYNFNKINEYITDVYETYEEALKAIEAHKAKTKITYFYVN